MNLNRITFSVTSPFLLIVLLFLNSFSVASTDQTANAINKAGMQRMLSQRMAKAYFLMGLGENNSLAQKQLTDAIALYEDNLAFLQRFEKKQRLTTVLPELEAQWHDYKALLEQPVNQDAGRVVLEKSDQILVKADELTKQLQTFSGTTGAELVNISGRQRMLAQRISKLYMAYCWKLKGEEALDEMLENLSEYEVALSFLRSAPLNSKTINHSLRKVMGQLKFAQKSFDKLNEGSYLIHVVNSTTDTMLKQMDEVTQLYVGVTQNPTALSQL